MGQTDRELDFGGSSRLLDGLARELKLSLTYIAKQAEYQSDKGGVNLSGIEKSATDTLRLIDSYLLCAQTEYGQQLLPMEPIGPGALLQEAAEYISRPSEVVICADYHEPAMANKRALVAALCSLAKIVGVSANSGETALYLVSQKGRGGGLSLGVFTKGFNAKPSEIQRSAELMGKSSMSLSNQTFASGVDLTIASQLALSMGGHLFPAKYKGRGGLSLSLLKSDQLSLVSK